ncbi:MAG: DUF4838 domain-containing protein, partial [Kiritimatiellae bacterium]|nr:DUF4838 domain-containing protein [Kiritimatiellia bacterium]
GKNANWPGFWEERGTLHAVYDFLQDGCGVRWFNSTDTGLLIPRRPTLTVKAVKVRRSPTFRYRDSTVEGDPLMFSSMYAWAKDGLKKELADAYEAAAYADLHTRYTGNDYLNAKKRRDTLYMLRIRNGGELCRANHSLYHFYDLYWKPSANPNRAKIFVEKRPELFAKGYEGDEPPQMCYASPELVRLVAEEARDYFNPDGNEVENARFNPHPNRRWGENFFSVEPMDNSSFCRCEPCQKLIELGKDHGAVEFYSKGIHSDYFFGFVNDVQKEFAKLHPGTDKRLVTLAYMSHAWPPKEVKLDPAVAVQYCFASSGNPACGEGYANDLRQVHKWAEDGVATGRPLYLWLYQMNRQNANYYGRYFCFPDFNAHTIAGQMKLFKTLGYRGMFHCGLGLEVDAYLAFRLMDNADLDVDALLDDYFKAQYGAGAKSMKKLYLALEEVYSNSKYYPKQKGIGGMERAWGYLGTAKRMEQYGKLLEQAKSLARTEREKRNVQLFELGIWKGMQAGRAQYVEKTAAPIPSVTVPRLPEAGGDPAKVAWERATPLEKWHVLSSSRPAPRALSGRIAHDGTYLYLELVDPCETGKLFVSPQVACFDEWEFYLGAQRGLPYRQFLVGPTGLTLVYLNGEVNWRLFVPHLEHGMKAVCDTSAPDKWIARVAVPLKEAIPGGAKAGDTLYFNAARVSSKEISGTEDYTIHTWVPFTTVLETDRFAEIRLEK